MASGALAVVFLLIGLAVGWFGRRWIRLYCSSCGNDIGAICARCVDRRHATVSAETR